MGDGAGNKFDAVEDVLERLRRYVYDERRGRCTLDEFDDAVEAAAFLKDMIEALREEPSGSG